MRLRAFLHTAMLWLGRCGESCCLGRSQIALGSTLDRDRAGA